MGGHAAGDVASSMIVGELAPLDAEDVTADQAIGLLEEALRSANAKLTKAMRDNADLAGMGSTTIVMLRTGNKLAMAHIGDSRAFMLRGDTFSQITKDHSFVQQLVDEGRISKEEAGHHPQRSVVTRVMTGQPDDEPDTSLREAKIGDRFLLCSDGLSDFVGADVIEEILARPRRPTRPPTGASRSPSRRSTRDNVTVIVADVVDADGDDLPTTVPQVVGRGGAGACATRPARSRPRRPRRRRPSPARPPAARDDRDDDDETSSSPSSPSARAARSACVGHSLEPSSSLAILAGGGYAAWAWSQHQFFVAADDGHVAIFRGVSQDLGPISLSRVESQSDVPCPTCPSTCRGRSSGPSRRATSPTPRPRSTGFAPRRCSCRDARRHRHAVRQRRPVATPDDPGTATASLPRTPRQPARAHDTRRRPPLRADRARGHGGARGWRR